jgi:hypothetical protein
VTGRRFLNLDLGRQIEQTTQLPLDAILSLYLLLFFAPFSSLFLDWVRETDSRSSDGHVSAGLRRRWRVILVRVALSSSVSFGAFSFAPFIGRPASSHAIWVSPSQLILFGLMLHHSLAQHG